MIDMYYLLALSYNWRYVVISQSYAVGFLLIRKYYYIKTIKGLAVVARWLSARKLMDNGGQYLFTTDLTTRRGVIIPRPHHK